LKVKKPDVPPSAGFSMTDEISIDCCHPEPGPELVSRSTISGSRVWFRFLKPM
jgi:hypothetical protein